MSKAKEYNRLQQLDTSTDTQTARLAAVEESLGQRDAVNAIKSKFERTQAALDEARARQRDLEWELGNTKQKLTRLEKTMYSGSVTNPKELGDMRQESEHLRRRRDQLQDRTLDAMMTVEELEEQAGTQREVWEGAEQAWADEQDDLRTEREALFEELAALRAERQAQASRLGAAGLARYERLRVKKGGLAVVPLQGTLCTGCQLSLPSADVQKVRVDAVVNFCPHCGRILIYGGPA